MPPSPILQTPKKVAFKDDVGKEPVTTIFHSQPIPTGVGFEEAAKVPNRKLKDHRYNSFKTWSGKLERQISTLQGKPPTEPPVLTPRTANLPVHRYFDALQGPELETLRVRTFTQSRLNILRGLNQTIKIGPFPKKII